jgi:hypothetical protein
MWDITVSMATVCEESKWQWEPNPDQPGGFRPVTAYTSVYGFVTLKHRDGKPLRVGDIERNALVYYDVATGTVLHVEKPKW